MGQIQGKMSEELAVVAGLCTTNNPFGPLVGTEQYTDYVDMQKFDQVMFIATIGNASDHLFSLRVYESILGGGTDNATALVLWGGATGCLTTIAHSATVNDNTEYVCSVRRDALSEGYRYVRAGIVSETSQTGYVGLIGVAMCPMYCPASDNDLSTVAIAQ